MDSITIIRAVHFGAKVVDLKDVVFTNELLRCVPGDIVRRHRVVPVGAEKDRITIAISDPSDLDTIDSLSKSLNRPIELVVSDESQIEALIDRLYEPEGNG